jgi:hypothetical protein
MKWKQKNGVLIDIKDMQVGHLKNCIKMLKRQLEDKPDFVDGGDSDGAYWAAISENRYNDSLAEDIKNVIRLLQKEIRSRK